MQFKKVRKWKKLLKIFLTEPQNSQTTTREIIIKPVDETKPYQKQLSRNQKYYEDNK